MTSTAGSRHRTDRVTKKKVSILANVYSLVYMQRGHTVWPPPLDCRPLKMHKTNGLVGNFFSQAVVKRSKDVNRPLSVCSCVLLRTSTLAIISSTACRERQMRYMHQPKTASASATPRAFIFPREHAIYERRSHRANYLYDSRINVRARKSRKI